MKNKVLAALVAALPSTALAGGIERTPQSMDILFAPERQVQIDLGLVRPRLSGSFMGTGSGDILRNFTQPGIAVKFPLAERLDAAVILDRPFGAGTRYPGGTGYFLQGSRASISSEALTGVLRYRFDGGFGVHGGVRLQQLRGSARVSSPLADYRLEAPSTRDVGYLVGVSWERPDIAARVALTYNSAVRHRFAATEEVIGAAPAMSTRFTSTTPESVNLEFQTGVAPDTLLFGSVRWARWSRFEIAPPLFASLPPGGGVLTSYDSNVVTYRLGLGRRFSETWSGAVTALHEPRSGDRFSNLGPRDGRNGVGVAATWTSGPVSVTGGLQYQRFGRATTVSDARFSGGSAVIGGLRMAVTF
ncbi:MAG: hypothetical protein ACXIUV_02765 [Alkalilacustris sp.]